MRGEVHDPRSYRHGWRGRPCRRLQQRRRPGPVLPDDPGRRPARRPAHPPRRYRPRDDPPPLPGRRHRLALLRLRRRHPLCPLAPRQPLRARHHLRPYRLHRHHVLDRPPARLLLHPPHQLRPPRRQGQRHRIAAKSGDGGCRGAARREPDNGADFRAGDGAAGNNCAVGAAHDRSNHRPRNCAVNRPRIASRLCCRGRPVRHRCLENRGLRHPCQPARRPGDEPDRRRPRRQPHDRPPVQREERAASENLLPGAWHLRAARSKSRRRRRRQDRTQDLQPVWQDHQAHG